jgi:hypothetical protein
MRMLIASNRVSISQRTPTVSMDNARWLWRRLHPQNSPEVHLRVGILAVRRIPAQHEEIIAKNSNERTRCHFWGQTLYLNRRCIPMGVDHLERNGSLPDNSSQVQGPIHYQTPSNQISDGTGDNREHAYRWGCTRGLGNLPRIRACHWTSFLRPSASRFPSFIPVANEDISVRARSIGSPMYWDGCEEHFTSSSS